MQIARSTQARLLKQFKDSTVHTYEEILDKNLTNIERVPDSIADERILGKFKEM